MYVDVIMLHARQNQFSSLWYLKSNKVNVYLVVYVFSLFVKGYVLIKRMTITNILLRKGRNHINWHRQRFFLFID